MHTGFFHHQFLGVFQTGFERHSWNDLTGGRNNAKRELIKGRPEDDHAKRSPLFADFDTDGVNGIAQAKLSLCMVGGVGLVAGGRDKSDAGSL